MPIRPGSTETHDEFIGRCMSAEASSFPNQDQRYAVCESMWSEGKMSKIKTPQQRVLNKLNIINGRHIGMFKGINLNEDGSVNMEEPCWSGYRQYGTKILDGREVPNCVPIE